MDSLNNSYDLFPKEDVSEDGGDEYPARKFSDKVVDSDC
jgi:hypothetical protein